MGGGGAGLVQAAAPPLPEEIHFFIKVKSWRTLVAQPIAMRAKVHSVRCKPQSGTGSTTAGRASTMARVTLYPEDIIGHCLHADRSMTPFHLGGPGAVPGRAAVLPTFVVHVSSRLNPGFVDTSIAFAPNTTSWLFRPDGSTRPRWNERPCVVVPMHRAGLKCMPFRTHTAAMNTHLDRRLVTYKLL